ncbi:MAG: YbhB/YbcL family Raf kinase inhibitor-like protein [Candidatus Thiodiazotropha sp. (ex Monitilora ramsayi)]|nr:YbhB/YbcL family Raf kinase inhibitor-like protein [Candidatus Thiodiazotropha sp. (ex Monitilora ramsayi)]
MNKLGLLTLIYLSSTAMVSASEFLVTSPQIKAGDNIVNEQVFNGFGCQGGNISPSLHWKNPPTGTKSFAVTVYDPDAPTGSGWWHWVAFNIPADVRSLPEGAGSSENKRMPMGSIQSRTDFGKPGYGGPCPPAGDEAHRYKFTVYALKTDQLPLDESAPAAMVGFYLHQNMLEKAVLEAKYGR